MSDPRKHVLIWVAPEFLTSQGLVRLFIEAGIVEPEVEDSQEYLRAAAEAGGFAMTGTLTDSRHGAGIWISPAHVPGLELMLPWQFVKSVVTAESPDVKGFGLFRDPARTNGKHPPKNPGGEDSAA